MTTAQALFAQHSERLFVQHDFTVFGQEAESLIAAGGDAAPANAEQIESLLRMTVSALAADASGREWAALAIDAYVADVWPVRIGAGLGVGGAARLAAEQGVRNLLQPQTNFAIRTAEASPGASPPAVKAGNAGSAGSRARPHPETPPPQQVPREEPPGTAARLEEGGDTEPSTKAAPSAEGGKAPRARLSVQRRGNAQPFGNRPINFDQVCDVLINRHETGRFRVVILGLATAGKTFFVQRLARSLGGNYVILDYWGAAPIGGSQTDRTTGIIYYELRSTHADWPTIDLFDVPGEAFRGLAQGDSPDGSAGAGTSPVLPSLYAVMAAIDLAIFIEPAFEVLAPDQYREHGDDFEDYRRADFEQQIRSANADISEEELEIQVEEALKQFRINHLNLASHFPNNFEVVRARAAHLRSKVADSLAKLDLVTFQSEINEFLKLNFANLPTKHRPLPIPGLYLLSKADEYVKRAGGHSEQFDRDPALSMADFARDRLKVYSRGFALFGVDFITSEPRVEGDPVREFFGGKGSAGFQGILTHWMRPAMRMSSPAKWWQFWKMGGRGARSPDMAIRMRCAVDREFRRLWKRRAGA